MTTTNDQTNQQAACDLFAMALRRWTISNPADGESDNRDPGTLSVEELTGLTTAEVEAFGLNHLATVAR